MLNESYTLLTIEQFEALRDGKSRVTKEKDKMVDLPEIDDEVVVETKVVVEDTKKTAVKMAFIGAGQAGGNLADAFYGLGYRRVVVVNTTEKDMQRLSVPVENRHVLKSPGGAGKNPTVGKECVAREYEDIFRLCQTALQGSEQIMICAGAGGGTGTGSVTTLVKLGIEYLSSVGVKNPEKKVGVIVTLPTKTESAAVQMNAADCLNELLKLAQEGKLSPLVLVDNARVMQLYGSASVVDVWSKANKNIAALFDVFNVLSAQDDSAVHVTFDPEDYKSVLSSGVLAFGRTKLAEIHKPTDVADAVRENVKKGLLVEGMDLGKATAGAGILVANAANLAKVSQEAMENAFGSLNRLMHQGVETKLHRGIYESSSDGIFMYTIIGGLGRPVERLAEMQAKAGAGYPAQ